MSQLSWYACCFWIIFVSSNYALPHDNLFPELPLHSPRCTMLQVLASSLGPQDRLRQQKFQNHHLLREEMTSQKSGLKAGKWLIWESQSFRSQIRFQISQLPSQGFFYYMTLVKMIEIYRFGATYVSLNSSPLLKLSEQGCVSRTELSL